ncbi:hypothetical protein B9N43_16585 [Denitratisoma sp. DHT3]|uniref:sensor histidine kinase n=1 Tax=Denitratisoma sp. DHT3 TaxID=1981880 RepID=UPI001198351F|nr:ATP-binding protein [Denitratisoma sp. DHT3]QDX82711.1 hypothetical protein B9N43_16585 [Denitratisoma sp. DHT3]
MNVSESLTPPRRLRRTWPDAGWAAAFCAAYVVLDWASYIDAFHRLNITPWSPAAALGLLFLLRGGPGGVATMLAALVAGDLIVRDLRAPLWAILLLDSMLAAGYMAIAWVLKRQVGEEGMFVDRAGLVKWAAIVMSGSLANSALFVSGLIATDQLPVSGWSDATLRFWVGDGVGIFVTLPLLWWLQDGRRRQIFRTTVGCWESLGYVALVMVTLWFTFAFSAEGRFRYSFVLYLPLVWAASRQGLVGAIFCASLLQLGMLVAGWLWEGASMSVFELQMRALMLAIVGFLIGVAVDEQRRAAADLRHTLRLAAAGEMAAALAHELNQPLTALSAYGAASERILERDGGSEQLRDVIRRMRLEAGRAAEVVRRLRDFFRTGATQLERFPLRELMDAALRPFRDKADQHGIVLSVSGASAAELYADRLQLEVVLRNLLSNAFEAVADNPAGSRRVRVTTELREEGLLSIRVEDSGPGVASLVSDSLFEPFVSTKSSGLGLGLAISRSIVDAHGGSLAVETGAHGCFRLILPIETMKVSVHG